MKRVATGYCAACDAQVTGKGSAARTGPDGCLYCGECMDLLRLLHQQRDPEGSVPEWFAATPATLRPAPRPRTGAFPLISSARTTSVPSGKKPPLAWIGAAVVALALVAGGVWRLGRSDAIATRSNVPSVPATTNSGSASHPVVPVSAANRPVTPPPVADPEPPKVAPIVDPVPEPEPDPPAQVAEDEIDAKDLGALRAMLGKHCVITGIVCRAAAARSGKVFRIDFGTDRNAFQAVIFPRQLAVFEQQFGALEQALTGKSVRVRGTVSEYQGRLQIILEETSQLELK